MTSVLLEKINKITKSRFGNIVSINKDTDQLNLLPQTSKVKQCAGKCKKSLPLLIFPLFLQYFLIFMLEKFKVKSCHDKILASSHPSPQVSCPNLFHTSLQNLKDLTWYNWKPSRHVRSHFNCSGGKFQRKVVLSITCSKDMNTAAEFNLPNQWRIQGGRPPTDQNFLNFMQFLGKSGKFVCWCPLPLEGWRPLLRRILYPPLLMSPNNVPLLIYPTNTKDTVGCVPPAFVVLWVGLGGG